MLVGSAPDAQFLPVTGDPTGVRVALGPTGLVGRF
jgi:hypothetical protein